MRILALVLLGLLAFAGGAEAALAVDATTSGNSGASSVTTHTITLPTCASGKRYMVQFARTGDTTVTNTWDDTPVFTTTLSLTQSAAGNSSVEVRTRVADGSEPATFAITTSISEKDSWRVDCVSGQHASTVPEGTISGAGASSSTPNPPSHTASWGSEANLWFTFTTFRSSATALGSVPGGCPTNYETAACIDTHSTGTGRTGLGSSYRVNAASSEDPDGFTLDASSVDYVVGTFVIRPAVVAGVAGGLINSTPLESLVGGGLVH